MNSIDSEEKKEAARLVMAAMKLKAPEKGNKPSLGIGRYLAREVAKLIVDEKIAMLDKMEQQDTGKVTDGYGQEFFKKTKTYLSLKQW